ncbi:MAG TPA: ABC transporter ATP-binding protein [Anaerolineae bacterium]|nr:ABC transporter ATP-binding protein [Anaerolineae bacterium]
MTQAALNVERVGHIYDDHNGHVEALDDISFEIAPGEFVCIVGPSGSGKSTLLRILAGLIPPQQGRVWLDGQLVDAPARSIGMVFQKANLMPWRSVRDNIALPLELANVSSTEIDRRAAELIELVGLNGFAQTYPHGLSGGMEQRVAIARALIHHPSILLLDEPFGALDALTRERMALELTRIWAAQKTTAQKTTVVMVTHSIQEAVFLSDRVLVMTDRPGRIARDVSVTLPRPRDLSVLQAETFADLAGQVRAAIAITTL